MNDLSVLWRPWLWPSRASWRVSAGAAPDHGGLDPLPDEALVRLAVPGQPQRDAAFEVLVRRHAAALHRLAASMVGPGAADDVMQDVWIAAYRSLGSFRGEAAFSTWLHRIALNACHRALRQQRPDALPLEGAGDPVAPHDPVQVGEQADLRSQLAAALACLPREQREALALRELSGLDYAEISALTGAELGTVKSRIHRARSALKTLLTRQGVTP